MKNFLIQYVVTPEAMKAMAGVTPEQRDKEMSAWMSWKVNCDSHIVDFGGPIMGGGHSLNTKGDLTPSHSMCLGYSILQADGLNEIKELIKDHPHLKWRDDVSIEILEYMFMG